MHLAKTARILIIAAMTITAISCSRDTLPCTATPPVPTSSSLKRIEQDPFNYVLQQYT